MDTLLILLTISLGVHLTTVVITTINYFLIACLRANTTSIASSPPKKVSVLIPARNEEKAIEKCVSGFLKQDYPNLEVIVLNDNSQDGTESILHRIRDAGHQKKLKVLQGKPLEAGWIGRFFFARFYPKSEKDDNDSIGIGLWIYSTKTEFPSLKGKTSLASNSLRAPLETIWHFSTQMSGWPVTNASLAWFPSSSGKKTPTWRSWLLSHTSTSTVWAKCQSCQPTSRPFSRFFRCFWTTTWGSKDFSGFRGSASCSREKLTRNSGDMNWWKTALSRTWSSEDNWSTCRSRTSTSVAKESFFAKCTMDSLLDGQDSKRTSTKQPDLTPTSALDFLFCLFWGQPSPYWLLGWCYSPMDSCLEAQLFWMWSAWFSQFSSRCS